MPPAARAGTLREWWWRQLRRGLRCRPLSLQPVPSLLLQGCWECSVRAAGRSPAGRGPKMTIRPLAAPQWWRQSSADSAWGAAWASGTSSSERILFSTAGADADGDAAVNLDTTVTQVISVTTVMCVNLS
ncbi:hypothetical protein ARTHRO8AJ_310003 [Arthrobacter sp. 8AJ]|nr:hypothetical protein ARTHRO8AJ_310003 [Arthrobacter sp. 8AJ]